MKWGLKGLVLFTVLAIGIVSITFWRGSLKGHTDKGSITGIDSTQNNVLPSKKNMMNHSYVLKDVAGTAALCVRDCRSMLNDLGNQLVHAESFSQKQLLMQQMLKQHPQFMSLTLLQNSYTRIRVGQQPLRPELQKQAQKWNIQDQFFISNLYPSNKITSPIAMTVGVPVVEPSQINISSLVAEVEMKQVTQVIQTQDQQFHTRTLLTGSDGNTLTYNREMNENYGNVNANSQSTKNLNNTKNAKVAGTDWTVHVSSVPQIGPKKTSRVENEVLVRFRNDLTHSQIQQACAAIQGRLVRSNSRHTYIFQSSHVSVPFLIQYFKGIGAVIAEPHYRYRTNQFDATSDTQLEEPNDTFYSTNQWNLVQISADLAWVKTKGSSKVTVAVVDTGVDLKHPDLQGRLVSGRNILDTTKSPQDDNGHGTHVAGIIGARTNNHEGIAGVNWRSKIMPVKVMGKDGTGSVVDIADGIVWAADHGANVINLSLGEYEDSDYLHEAVQYAYKKGVVVVSAMGNDGTNKPCYPAAYPEVVAVAATDDTGTSADFSNYGPNTSVSAPGVAIPSTYLNHHYVTLSGTSMASPHVAGVAALIKSINPKLTPKDVRKILQNSADDLGPVGRDDHYGYGQVNTDRAVQGAKDSIRP